MKRKIFIVFGTRPEAIKMAPVYHAFKNDKTFDVKLILSGQHEKMLYQAIDVFSMDYHYDLKIMVHGQTLTHITTKVLSGLEKIFKIEKPDLLIVHGDTTTTFASALSGFYHRIPVAHVEAGLRTFDLCQPYPEEANRTLTDKISTLLFAPTKKAKENLINEGIDRKKIFITGNTIVDALMMAKEKAIRSKYGIKK
ncbi:MAG: UDP-N-acetylglucosamine 2-epimerase (non-hydrolyzing), partial [Caldiserica bacterium]